LLKKEEELKLFVEERGGGGGGGAFHLFPFCGYGETDCPRKRSGQPVFRKSFRRMQNLDSFFQKSRGEVEFPRGRTGQLRSGKSGLKARELHGGCEYSPKKSS